MIIRKWYKSSVDQGLIKKGTLNTVIISVGLIAVAFFFRARLLDGDTVVQKAFSSFLGQYPFANAVVERFGSIGKQFMDFKSINYCSFLDSTLKTLVMILIQPIIGRVFYALTTFDKELNSVESSTLSRSVKIDLSDSIMESSSYRRREMIAEALSSLAVTLSVTYLLSKMDEVLFAQISGFVPLLKTVLVVLLLALSVLILAFRNLTMSVASALLYRIVNIFVKYGCRCMANGFFLLTVLMFIQADFHTDSFNSIISIVICMTGWFLFAVFEDLAPSLITKRIPLL